MIAFTVALGASLSTAMLNTMLGVGDKVNMELKTYGANINVLPKDASLLDDIYGFSAEDTKITKYLREDELGLVKTIFWAFNIVDYTPYLNVSIDVGGSKLKIIGTWFDKHLELPTGEKINTGMRRLKSWWTVEGDWVADDSDDSAMVGSLYALRNNIKVGSTLGIAGHSLTVRGIFESGSEDDDAIYVPLHVAQSIGGVENAVSRIEVSALTTPDNDLARKAAKNPKSLTLKEWEVWYCTAYVSAICYQLQEVITDAVAKPIRQVAESEGDILNKTTLLMVLITVLSMMGSALGISNIVTAGVMERRAEIGLKKALGASNVRIILSMLTEILIVSIVGGAGGYFIGLGITQVIGYGVFGSPIPATPMVVPIVAFMILLVTIFGSIPAMRYLLKLNPTEVLHGR